MGMLINSESRRKPGSYSKKRTNKAKRADSTPHILSLKEIEKGRSKAYTYAL